MELTTKQIEAVKKSGLLGATAKGVSGDDLYDLVYDALTNDAPEVEMVTAEQDKGEYDIVIRGVPGAYFVDAPEYEPEGFFDTLSAARRAVSHFMPE